MSYFTVDGITYRPPMVYPPALCLKEDNDLFWGSDAYKYTHAEIDIDEWMREGIVCFKKDKDKVKSVRIHCMWEQLRAI